MEIILWCYIHCKLYIQPSLNMAAIFINVLLWYENVNILGIYQISAPGSLASGDYGGFAKLQCTQTVYS